ncbi:methionyl-tRNA formyltransferase [Arthrobacter sp. Hiyo4]|nr:methionyl-tRNA formyltransferase [Arthrobacter sp. Hiyo4]
MAVPSLNALIAAGFEIVAVLTRPDAPIGRKRVLTPSPVAARAAELGIDVIHATRVDEAVTAKIAATKPDVAAIVAYGGLIPRPALDVPPNGWINLHFSLLPAWRGAAPCSGPSWPATTSPGQSPSCWKKVWTPARCSER